MRVLIVEDDPMVAMIHKEYFKRKSDEFNLTHVTTLNEAIKYIENNKPDFIILDNYLIDGKGIDLLEHIKGIPVIMITAATDKETVEIALNNGVIDYLVKPFVYERFSQAIDKVEQFTRLLSIENINQDMLDNYFSAEKKEGNEENIKELPKGLSKITLKKVIENILQRDKTFNTQQIADELEISRITIRKYLNYLVEINILSEDADYLTYGRPVSIFTVLSKEELNKLL